MASLSAHFDQSEFELTAPIPADAIAPYTHLCEWILEPVRAEFGPIIITSGYRSPESNTAAHGQPNSEHMATADFCAADFKINSFKGDMRTVFDAMRNNPELPWHQLILEREASGHTIIHVSWNRLKSGVRSCKSGSTNNASPYVDVVYVAYHPTQQLPGVEEATTS